MKLWRKIDSELLGLLGTLFQELCLIVFLGWLLSLSWNLGLASLFSLPQSTVLQGIAAWCFVYLLSRLIRGWGE